MQRVRLSVLEGITIKEELLQGLTEEQLAAVNRDCGTSTVTRTQRSSSPTSSVDPDRPSAAERGLFFAPNASGRVDSGAREPNTTRHNSDRRTLCKARWTDVPEVVIIDPPEDAAIV